MVKRLESIELQGFKTFSTITRLEFPGQITAIVGPNGSGKSNIADSIRWVLGEQSYSVLRAKRTEDMIFSGSQQRSRAGMASATITFNNEDAWLPIEFSEVSISRRAYRDGQNEYLLNGQKVRLKDISELLSQTGLSERTYTIIGQGLVDVALALKPDERRKLFEEAAGIGLYRSRKEESLRRLETTRKNLDRVLDIMTEIRPRLRSLERQASRFEEYQQLRTDLHEFLREWYGFHWHQKQQDLQNYKNAYQDQEKRLVTLRKKYQEAEVEVEDSRNQLQENRKALEKAHSELSGNHRKLETSTRELAIIDERQRSYNHQKGNLEIDIANIEEEIRELESQEESLKADINRRLVAFNEATDEANQAEIDLTEIVVKKTAIEDRLGEARNKRIGLETEKVQVSAHREEMVNRVETLKKEVVKIQDSVKALELERSGKAENVAALEKNLQTVEKKYIDIKKELEEKTNLLNKIQAERQGLNQKISTEETRHAKLQAQLDVLIQAEAALSGYSEGSKRIVENSIKGSLPKGIEPLSKFIIVDEMFENAISAALGEFTDLLVVPSSGTETVIDYLESKESERVALVSLDQARTQNSGNKISKTDEIFGYANELIQVDPKYQKLVDKLFSDIVIVKDKQIAKRIQPNLVGSQKVVTLQGLVFQANGVMVSGQGAAGKRIGRTRKQSEMQQELAQLTLLISKLTDKKLAVEKSENEILEAREKLVLETREVEELKQESIRNHQEARESYARLGEQLGWHTQRLEEIQKNIEETNGIIQSDIDRIEDFETRVETLLNEEKEIKSAQNELQVFEIQQSVNQWQTQSALAQNALETSKQRFTDHHNRIIDAQQRLETYQSRLEDLDSGLEEISQTEALLRGQGAEVNQVIEKIKTERIDPLTVTGEELEKTVSALEKLETHSHQQVIVAERNFTTLQLELSRREDQLNNLKEKIEDDFGLVSYDYDKSMDGPTPLPFDDGLIENLPRVETLSDDIERDIKELKNQIRRIGSINPEAQQEYYEVKDRFEFLTNQIADLEKASKDLREVIETLDELMERDFLKTFKAVEIAFSEYFSELFNGGEAKLMFSDEDNPVEGGIDIEARLPGRRRQGLALLSGGERSLTAVALIFALLKVSPTPFCILDEVDAMLDESNVGRFIDLLKELARKTQFVIITHNRNTVQAADVIYGVTMGRDSTSQMISLKLEEVDEAFLE